MIVEWVWPYTAVNFVGIQKIAELEIADQVYFIVKNIV